MWFPEEYQLLHENEQQYVRDGDFYERWKASSVKNKEENQLNYLQVKLSESNPDDESIYVESLFKDEFGVNNPQKWKQLIHVYTLIQDIFILREQKNMLSMIKINMLPIHI